MKKGQIKNSLLLLLAAGIWGTAFVAQSVGMEHVEPFTFTFARSMIGGLFLIPCISFFRWLKKRENSERELQRKAVVTKTEWIGGVCCGLVLCAAANFQQFGIAYTTVGKAGFITALYVVIVPVFGLFFKKKVPPAIWFCVGLSVVGLYLLCMTEGSFTLAYGDLMVLLCAVLFSCHIMVIDYFSPKCDGVVLSCIQFLVCGTISGVIMLFTETPRLNEIWAAMVPILYVGVMSSGVAYTLQVVTQKNLNPTIASLIMCMESVISALAGWIILGQALSKRELLGCVLMFAAIVLAQLPMPKKKSSGA